MIQLGDRVFRFSVASKLVGFHIFRLKSFFYSSCKIFFHLWGNGGPRWDLELFKFPKEEEATWLEVRRNSSLKKHSSATVVDQRNNNFSKHHTFADVVKNGFFNRCESYSSERKQSFWESIGFC